MNATHEDDAGAGWRKLLALLLGVAAVGLPINNISDYALLVILAVVIFCGEITARPRAWAAAAAIIAISVLGQAVLSPPRIEEGHYVFLPSPALERGLPRDVYRHMATEFDAQYPPAQRCDPKNSVTGRAVAFPIRRLPSLPMGSGARRPIRVRSLLSTFPTRYGCASGSLMSIGTIGTPSILMFIVRIGSEAL